MTLIQIASNIETKTAPPKDFSVKLPIMFILRMKRTLKLIFCKVSINLLWSELKFIEYTLLKM